MSHDQEGSLRDAVAAVLLWCNWDWRVHGHMRFKLCWTSRMTEMYPSGLSKAEVVDIVCASMERLGFFDTARQKPAKSRWWSLAAALSSQVLGFNLNRLLPDSLQHAFPRWDSGDPDGEQLSDDYRAMMKAKTWRAKVVTADPAFRRLSTSVLLCAEGLDRLASRLQHMSAHGGSVLLAVLHDRTNPFVEAQLLFADILCEAEARHSTILATLFHFFGQDASDAAELASLIIELILTQSSMLWTMCQAPLKEMPHPLAGLADVLTTDKLGLLQNKVYGRHCHHCDLDVGFTLKVKAGHSALHALTDRHLMLGISMWARHTLIDNMCLERLLAQFRHASSVSRGVPVCERHISSGLLSQVATAHRAAGGNEPSLTTRGDLSCGSVPTVCAEREKRQMSQIRPWLLYVNEKIKIRRAAHGKLPKEQARAERRALAREYKHLHEVVKRPYIDEADRLARHDLIASEISQYEKEAKDHAYEVAIGDTLWQTSCNDMPIKEQIFDEVAASLKASLDGTRRGITAYKDL